MRKGPQIGDMPGKPDKARLPLAGVESCPHTINGDEMRELQKCGTGDESSLLLRGLSDEERQLMERDQARRMWEACQTMRGRGALTGAGSAAGAASGAVASPMMAVVAGLLLLVSAL